MGCGGRNRPLPVPAKQEIAVRCRGTAGPRTATYCWQDRSCAEHNPPVPRPSTDYTPDELDAEVAQLLQGDATDPLEDPATLRALAKLRLKLGQDVIFVSRFQGDTRVIALVESEEATVSFLQGKIDPLDQSWCYSVVSGRLPEFVLDARSWVERGAVPAPRIHIGTHISTPIRLEDGAVFGTLCAFSGDVVSGSATSDLARLRLAAEWLGRRLSQLRRDQARQ